MKRLYRPYIEISLYDGYFSSECGNRTDYKIVSYDVII